MHSTGPHRRALRARGPLGLQPAGPRRLRAGPVPGAAAVDRHGRAGARVAGAGPCAPTAGRGRARRGWIRGSWRRSWRSSGTCAPARSGRPSRGFVPGSSTRSLLSAVMSVGFGLAALRQPAERVLDVVLARGGHGHGAAGARRRAPAPGGRRRRAAGGAGRRAECLRPAHGDARARRPVLLAAAGAGRGSGFRWRPPACSSPCSPARAAGPLAIIAGILTFLVVGRVPLRRLALLSAARHGRRRGRGDLVHAPGPGAEPLRGGALPQADAEVHRRQAGEGEVYLSGREVLYAAGLRARARHAR